MILLLRMAIPMVLILLQIVLSKKPSNTAWSRRLPEKPVLISYIFCLNNCEIESNAANAPRWAFREGANMYKIQSSVAGLDTWHDLLDMPEFATWDDANCWLTANGSHNISQFFEFRIVVLTVEVENEIL